MPADKKPWTFRDWARYYFLDKYLFEEINKNFHKRGYLTPEEFFCIIIWKANRKKTDIRDSLRRRKISIKKLTNDIYKEKDPGKKIALLTGKKGIKYIGIPIASAILTVMYPDDFTILDYRVWDDLTSKLIVDGSQPQSIPGYLKYIGVCKGLAKKYHLTLRQVDQISWGRSFHRDLEKLLK